MTFHTPRLSLDAIPPRLAMRIVAGEPDEGDRWHPQYPLDDELDPLRSLAAASDPHPVFTMYVIRSADDGLAIGGLGFFGPPDESGAVEIGYGLVESARGRGLATEAVAAALSIARDHGARTVRASTDAANHPSQRVLEKAGFSEVRRDGETVSYARTLGELLAGGNMNVVEREGDTVLRLAGPWTPTVHRYLDYLRRAGIAWAPRPIAIEGNRERLGFIDAEVPDYPLPDWVWRESVLVDGAARLRELHDASIGFALDDAVWQSRAKVPAEVICHNDFAPHNLAFADGALVGAIDFDMCSPGPRIWDIAYFATRAVPLTASTPSNAPGMDQARHRVEIILRAYGSTATWDDVIRLAVIRLIDLAEISREKAEELGKPALLENANDYERDAEFLSGWRDGAA